MIGLGNLTDPTAAVSLLGLLVIAALQAREVHVLVGGNGKRPGCPC